MNASQTQKVHFLNFYPKPSESRYVDDLTDYFEKERASGKALYHLTVTYTDPIADPLTPEKACRHFNAFRKRLLHKMFGPRYNTPECLEIEPRVFAFLDTSFSKSKKTKLQKAPKHESTYHHHCVLVVDASISQRLEGKLDKDNRESFKKNPTLRSILRSMDFQKISPTRDDTRTVVDYASATARKHPNDEFMLQIYPIARNEFRNAA